MRWQYDVRNKTSMFTNTRHVKAYVVYVLLSWKTRHNTTTNLRCSHKLQQNN